jgi:hypothetical protein
MRTGNGIVIGALAITMASAGAAHAQSSVKVFVTIAQPDPVAVGASAKELRRKWSDLEKARTALEKQLKKEHGKEQSRWPDESVNTLTEARRAEVDAEANYLLAATNRESVSDTVNDIKSALDKVKSSEQRHALEIVDSVETADLIVDVIARRSWKQAGLPSLVGRDNTFDVYFSIRAAARELKMPSIKSRFGGIVVPLSTPSTGRPFWRFKVEGLQAWRSAATTAASVVESFADATAVSATN